MISIRVIIFFSLLIMNIQGRTSTSRSSSSSSSLPDNYKMTCTCDVPDSSDNYCSHYNCVKESYTKSSKCFPGNSLVKIIDKEENQMKEILMEKLEIGDQIIAYDLQEKEIIIDEVIGFLHKQVGVTDNFLLISTQETELKITPTHIIFIKNMTEIKEIMAKEIQIGDVILIYRNEEIIESNVINIQPINENNLYAPLTRSGTLIVDNVITSCYASFKYQDIAHNVFLPYRMTTKILSSKYFDYQIDNINWYAWLLMKISEQLPQKFNFQIQIQ